MTCKGFGRKRQYHNLNNFPNDSLEEQMKVAKSSVRIASSHSEFLSGNPPMTPGTQLSVQNGAEFPETLETVFSCLRFYECCFSSSDLFFNCYVFFKSVRTTDTALRIWRQKDTAWQSRTYFILLSCLAYFSTLKMEAIYSSEALVDDQRNNFKRWN
jgi:hypothetical protein